MSRASLRCLCEVLLSDICTKQVSENINAAISRLAIVHANRTVLTDLIAEVVVDLAAQSENKLVMFLNSLLAVRRKKGREGSGSSITSRSSANELPLGEAGGRYHERLLRAMQTLDSVAAKTKRSLLDLTPADQLAPAWSSLHNVLTELKAYILDEDEGKTENTSRPQSTLISLLSKLLPVVEGFFLVHTTDILNGDASGNSTSNSKLRSPASATANASANVTTNASTSAVDNTVDDPVAAMSSEIPSSSSSSSASSSASASSYGSAAISPLSSAGVSNSNNLGVVNISIPVASIPSGASVLDDIVSTNPISVRTALDVSTRMGNQDGYPSERAMARTPPSHTSAEPDSASTIRPVNQPMPGELSDLLFY